MAHNNASITDRDINILHSGDINIEADHAKIISSIEQLFTAARPRLLRIAHLNDVAPDGIEDVVQETLMEAWRHLANLHEPQRFNAWLDGICRNVCRRQKSTLNNTLSLHELLATSSFNNGEPLNINTPLDIVDPFSTDPLEELSQQDLAELLDHAMGYLPAETRKLMEMCYFAEIPQREAATRLGLTIGALELRLHRARLQLRQVLNGELRTEAQSFGLIPDTKDALDWQQTRQWCFLCGKRRMLSRFETRSDGHVDLCTRCPECSSIAGIIVGTLSSGFALIIDAFTFIVSAMSLAAMKTAKKTMTSVITADEIAKVDSTEKATLTRQENDNKNITTFWQLIRTSRFVQVVFIVSVVANLAFGGLIEVALPELVRGSMSAGASGFGFILASFGAGALSGSLIIGSLGGIRHRALIALLASLVQALAIALVPFSGGLIGAMICMFIAGISNSVTNVLFFTLIQQLIPRHLLGRIMSIIMLAGFGSYPLSVLITGIIVVHTGPVIFFPVCGIILAIAIVFGLFQRELREL